MTRGDGAAIPALQYPEYDTFTDSDAGGGERSFPLVSLPETAARFSSLGDRVGRASSSRGRWAPGRPLRLEAD